MKLVLWMWELVVRPMTTPPAKTTRYVRIWANLRSPACLSPSSLSLWFRPILSFPFPSDPPVLNTTPPWPLSLAHLYHSDEFIHTCIDHYPPTASTANRFPLFLDPITITLWYRWCDQRLFLFLSFSLSLSHSPLSLLPICHLTIPHLN